MTTIDAPTEPAYRTAADTAADVRATLKRLGVRGSVRRGHTGTDVRCGRADTLSDQEAIEAAVLAVDLSAWIRFASLPWGPLQADEKLYAALHWIALGQALPKEAAAAWAKLPKLAAACLRAEPWRHEWRVPSQVQHFPIDDALAAEPDLVVHAPALAEILAWRIGPEEIARNAWHETLDEAYAVHETREHELRAFARTVRTDHPETHDSSPWSSGITPALDEIDRYRRGLTKALTGDWPRQFASFDAFVGIVLSRSGMTLEAVRCLAIGGGDVLEAERLRTGNPDGTGERLPPTRIGRTTIDGGDYRPLGSAVHALGRLPGLLAGVARDNDPPLWRRAYGPDALDGTRTDGQPTRFASREQALAAFGVDLDRVAEAAELHRTLEAACLVHTR